MRAMRINERTFYYAVMTGYEIKRDSYGNEIGRKAIYESVQKAKGHFSAGGGEIGSSKFGVLTDYNKVLNPMPLNFPMDETSLIWVDVVPVINEDGSSDTPPDYAVRHISTSVNHKSYALMQIGKG